MPPERRTTRRKAGAGVPGRKRPTKPAPAARQSRDRAADAGGDERPVARGIWSGSITFGLVTVPVELYSVTRPAQPGLRMLASDGTPLVRIFVSAEGKPLDDEQIERGYEMERDRFVLVSDDELEKLAPRRSRDIELTRFVPTDAIDPARFVRPYLALPSGEQTKAYRLLAETMEASGRAAIATFVMRGRAQAAAIVAESGLLRVYTLRFGDELRDPAKMGIHAPAKADARLVAQMTRALGTLEKQAFDPDAAFVEDAPDLMDLARREAREGQGRRARARGGRRERRSGSGRRQRCRACRRRRRRLGDADPGSTEGSRRRPQEGGRPQTLRLSR